MAEWSISDKDLQGITPLKARDIVIKCFFEAQKETLRRVKQHQGKAMGDDELNTMITRMVKMKFQEVKADYEHPTKETLMKVVMALGESAASFGTPQDIIEHHKEELMKVFGRL